MMLALVLLTLDDLPSPPEFDGGEILTPIALRHFPQSPYAECRSASLAVTLDTSVSSPRIPTLVETLHHYARANPGKCDLSQYREQLSSTNLWDSLRMNVPFYLHIEHDYLRYVSSRRASKAVMPQIVYLTTATLVVVPSTLQAQWSSEILKHCSSAIRTLTIRTDADIPSPQSLASDYDVRLRLQLSNA